MAEIAVGTTAKSASGTPRPPRFAFIDNIRWSMIVLVLSMHAADT
jgi:hypothetical protein